MLRELGEMGIPDVGGAARQCRQPPSWRNVALFQWAVKLGRTGRGPPEIIRHSTSSKDCPYWEQIVLAKYE